MLKARWLVAAALLAGLPLRAQDVVIQGTQVRLRRNPTKQAGTIRVLDASDTLRLVRPDTMRSVFLHATTTSGDTGWVSISFAYRRRITGVDTTQSLATTSCGVHCGVERWRVKTLTDADRDEVDLTPVSRTVAQLRRLDQPEEKPDDGRIGEVERTLYEVRGVIIGWVREDDKDIHVVLATQSNHDQTIIIEVPNSACQRVCMSNQRMAFDSARQVLIDRLGNPPSTFKTLPTPVRVVVRGVGFFDQEHSNPQHGVAPNNFELHPVIRVVFP